MGPDDYEPTPGDIAEELLYLWNEPANLEGYRRLMGLGFETFETEVVTPVTKNVTHETKTVTFKNGVTMDVTDVEETVASVLPLRLMCDEFSREIGRLEGKVAMLEAELAVRRPKALSSAERVRRYRQKHGD